MSELTSNNNFLQPSGFTISISRENYPNLEFYAQSVTTPNIDVSAALQAARRRQIPQPGDTVAFGQLDISFLMDEDMTSYDEMLTWVGRMVNQKQTDINTSQVEGSVPTEADIIVSILTSSNTPSKRMKFYGCFPTSISGVELNASAGAEIPLVFTTTFDFTQFELL